MLHALECQLTGYFPMSALLLCSVNYRDVCNPQIGEIKKFFGIAPLANWPTAGFSELTSLQILTQLPHRP